MAYGGGSWGFRPYVPVHERRARAQRALPRLLGKGRTATPVVGKGRSIAASFWGQAWCRNLERYGDFANRIPRGRTYVRNGSVVHLDVRPGEALAYVSGSELYVVTVAVRAVPAVRWKQLCAACASSIDSIVELLRGDLDDGVMERVCSPETGLFPSPREIEFHCSCPDWAGMCKHVAAVLYGIGVRFDDDPDVLFRLRRVRAADLVAGAGEGMNLNGRTPTKGKVLAEADVAGVFGVEFGEAAPPLPAKPAPARPAAPPSAKGTDSHTRRPNGRATEERRAARQTSRHARRGRAGKKQG